ncbi:hypothetical protein BGZ94_007340, partial [Podila epigama]
MITNDNLNISFRELAGPCRDFGMTENEDEIGFFCGLIASSFFLAQFCTSIFWGYMSDRYGRRPILLFGLIGSTITILLFGLSKTLIWAIVTRSLCGLLNGNVGVAKSMLGEIADASNQAQAFSIFGFAWGIGMIIGPVLGGYLANPAKTFPEIFGDWQFFIDYPYFLPCLVAALGSVIGFIVGYFFLEETKSRDKRVAASKDDESFVGGDDRLHGGAKYTTQDPSFATLNESDDNEDNFHAADGRSDSYPINIKPHPSLVATEDQDLYENQPLLLPSNAAQPQQARSAGRRGATPQYGSMATLSNEPNLSPSISPSPYNDHLGRFAPTSARSTLSRRTAPNRPSLPFHDVQQNRHRQLSFQETEVADIGYARTVDRPQSATGHRPSLYISSGLLSSERLHPVDAALVRQPEGTSPRAVTSLNMYGYASVDAVLEGRNNNVAFHGLETGGCAGTGAGAGVGGGGNGGRMSRLSQATSQIFLLPPDSSNKDPDAPPVQVVVIQTETGLSPLSITTIVAYAMLALHSIVFEEVYTLYVVTPMASHGLGWNAIQLSTSLACMGLVQLFLQFVAYPRLERRFSAVMLFRWAQVMYACMYLTFPLIREFLVDENEPVTGGQTATVRYTILALLVLKYTCSVSSYTSVMVMITNSSPPHLLGTVNGIGQTSASFMRAFGPALGGILWAWSLSNKL